MRGNLRIRKFGITLFLLLSHTQTLEGVTSLQRNGKHTPFFDLENCSQIQAENALKKLQAKYWLPDIFLTSDMERSFRAWCYAQVEFSVYLRMMLDLLDDGVLDWNFFWWTVKQGKATLRASKKKGRPPQRLVSYLESYPAQIPTKGIERAVYDTGIQKRGSTLLLGERGKNIHA